jgi:molybdopterin synthase sulfur carrier subunit
MPRVVLTGSIRQHAGDRGVVQVSGATARAVVKALEASSSGLRGWVIDEQGALRRHVRLFLGGVAVSLDAPIGADDELHIVASISGG